MTTPDDYQLIGVSVTASKDEIKRAFRQRALQSHPDAGGEADDFIKLQRAFKRVLQAASEISAQSDTLAKNGNGTTASTSTIYDPFVDPLYATYEFYEPVNNQIAAFERSAFATGCPHCGGKGFITKLVHPEKGFMGKEKRFCICQKIGVK